MSHIDQEFAFNRKWWWDPIDMEIFKILEQVQQRQLLAASLEVQAEVMKVQAEGLARMASIVSAGKQASR